MWKSGTADSGHSTAPFLTRCTLFAISNCTTRKSRSSGKKYETLSRALQYLTKNVPNWRTARHENGTPLYSLTGTLLNDEGDRSIFDDVDE
jgi:hypothetical protein